MKWYIITNINSNKVKKGNGKRLHISEVEKVKGFWSPVQYVLEPLWNLGKRKVFCKVIDRKVEHP